MWPPPAPLPEKALLMLLLSPLHLSQVAATLFVSFCAVRTLWRWWESWMVDTVCT